MASKTTNVLGEQAGSLGVSADAGVTGNNEIEVCQVNVVEGVKRGRLKQGWIGV